MENKAEKPNPPYYILAMIFGALTGWVVTESLIWVIVGILLGVLTAAFYVNVLVNKVNS